MVSNALYSNGAARFFDVLNFDLKLPTNLDISANIEGVGHKAPLVLTLTTSFSCVFDS